MGSNKLIKDNNDLRSWCLNNNHESILEEWDYDKNGSLSPDTVTHASNKKVWWKCPKGHSYESKVGNRIYLKRGCPYCSGHKTLAGYNDFQTWCLSNGREDLLKEWDYDKNEVDPTQVSAMNNRKVWWKCSLAHEWNATIGSRTTGRPSGCPYCSNPPKKILVGFNDLESWCMNNGKDYLLKEWNYERNSASPREYFYGSGKRVWWKCSRGHEWRVSPSNRVQGTSCPVCSRTQTSFPEQAIAFYLSKSFDILQRYRLKGYELDIFLENYGLGIEYDGRFFHTSSGKAREEAKKKFYKERGIRLIRVKENKTKTCVEGDIVFFVPKKANYLDDSFNMMLQSLALLVEQITGKQTYKDMDVVRDEMLIREQYASLVKESSFAVVCPDMVSEWDVEKNEGMTPDNFSASAHTKVWWKCVNGHSWQAAISSRSGRRLGCPYCAGQRTISGENDLESWCKANMPQLLDEWDYDKNTLLPSEITKTSNKKVWWKCAEGHEWEAVIANRVHGTRCPLCYNGRDSSVRKMSLTEWCNENNKQDLLGEWDYDKNGSTTPDNVTKGSHLKVWWKCEKGHEWEAQIKSRTYNHGCPYCSGTLKRVLAGENDLVTWCNQNNKQYILKEWDYDSNGELKPEMFTAGSHRRINWMCSKGHKWSAVIKQRTRYRGNMCPDCKKDTFE